MNLHSITTVVMAASSSVARPGKNRPKQVKPSRNNRESDSDSDRFEDERYNGVGNNVGDQIGKEGFDGDLNGEQFPPINGLAKNGNENIRGKRSEVKEGENNSDNGHRVDITDENEKVVKQSNVRSQVWESKSVGKNLANIVKSNRLDNKLLDVPTQVSDNGENIVIFNDEIIEYHIRRMWYRFGLKDVIAENGVFYFKFQDEGINEAEPKRIPVWVKIRNVPMEAWSVKGISALASSIWKPVIMDEITTKMCVTGVGRIGFARVLVETDAEKGIKEIIEILYKSKSISEGTKKFADNGQNNRRWNDRRNVRLNTSWQTNNRFEYRKRKEDGGKGKGLEDNEGIDVEANGMKKGKEQVSKGIRNLKDKNNDKENKEGSTSAESSNVNGMLGSNRFTLLNELVNENDLIPNVDQRKIVDELDRKELFNAVKEIEENEDVMEEDGVECLCSNSDKQKEVKKLIKEEGLQFCGILETHVKYKNIKKTCENMFGNWEYTTNGEDNNKGCRIMIITNGVPWVILGDFNVTLKVFEHSNGGAYPTSEMNEFQDYVNKIEVDDLHSKGFNYTWTKSLKNPKCSTLKKLDRIMVNEDFVDKFQQAHRMFLPYMISDHSPIIVKMPNRI
ncbi:RNA-directed DNA polymerase, eukaryota, reverse transcriptase zinc-binding domain protein [Tanacetum coccineum]